ncbi:glycosyltransferase family 4 protein [Zunongwangia atlantica]|nr:glycosyltransferase [Zunongwangia atlantica]
MQRADHIHLRCPGNVALLGCIIQIFFPSKPKTVKYAGNWDPNSKQPWSYKLQKGILSNTFLSKNIKVLVYGEWPNQTKNILPFFTASFSESEVQNVEKDFTNELKFLFVGSLVEGKQPLYAIRLVEELKNKGRIVNLKIFGEGPLRPDLENYIQTKNLSTYITICGGVSLDQLKNEYKRSHFSILPSKSEGWPKAVAEAMFFGCIPVATRVSCVPWMLKNGKRGILLNDELENDLTKLKEVLQNSGELQKMATEAMNWSQHYTVEYFEEEIKKLL